VENQTTFSHRSHSPYCDIRNLQTAVYTKHLTPPGREPGDRSQESRYGIREKDYFLLESGYEDTVISFADAVSNLECAGRVPIYRDGDGALDSRS